MWSHGNKQQYLKTCLSIVINIIRKIPATIYCKWIAQNWGAILASSIASLRRSASIARQFLRMMTVFTDTSSPELMHSLNNNFCLKLTLFCIRQGKVVNGNGSRKWLGKPLLMPSPLGKDNWFWCMVISVI